MVEGVTRSFKKGIALGLGVLILVQIGHILETLTVRYSRKLRNLFAKMYVMRNKAIYSIFVYSK